MERIPGAVSRLRPATNGRAIAHAAPLLGLRRSTRDDNSAAVATERMGSQATREAANSMGVKNRAEIGAVLAIVHHPGIVAWQMTPRELDELVAIVRAYGDQRVKDAARVQ